MLNWKHRVSPIGWPVLTWVKKLCPASNSLQMIVWNARAALVPNDLLSHTFAIDEMQSLGWDVNPQAKGPFGSENTRKDLRWDFAIRTHGCCPLQPLSFRVWPLPSDLVDSKSIQNRSKHWGSVEYPRSVKVNETSVLEEIDASLLLIPYA